MIRERSDVVNVSGISLDHNANSGRASLCDPTLVVKLEKLTQLVCPSFGGEFTHLRYVLANEPLHRECLRGSRTDQENWNHEVAAAD